jgi:predicted nucleotidyltransferase
LNSISGIHFEEAYTNHKQINIDGIEISLISLADLRKNKSSSGRHKDLDDLENLPHAEK